MLEGNFFTDIIPYPKGSHIERQRKERRSTRIVLEELGAENIQVIHLVEENKQHYLLGESQEKYAISGIISDNIGTLKQIETVLRHRGGKSFSANRCSIERR